MKAHQEKALFEEKAHKESGIEANSERFMESLLLQEGNIKLNIKAKVQEVTTSVSPLKISTREEKASKGANESEDAHQDA